MLDLMLCKTWDDKPLTGKRIAEPKEDGWRATWQEGKVWGRDRGRGMAQYHHPRPLIEELEALPWCELDGEMFAGCIGDTASVIKTGKPELIERTHYDVFDILSLEGESLIGLPYSERRVILASVIPPDASGFVRNLRPFKFQDLSDPMALAKLAVENGFEGLVFKDLGAPYLPGIESAYWTRLKPIEDEDVLIVGALMGKDSLVGTLGALLVENATGDRFKVGSGFKREDRSRLWKMHQAGTLAGQTVSISKQADGKIVGRFSRFIRLREDMLCPS